MLIGSMSGSLTLEDIYSLILEQAPEVSGVDISILSSERDTVYLAVVCLKKMWKKWKKFFGRVDLPGRLRV